MIDQIAFNHYGNTSGGQVEAILAANVGLAAMGPVLGAGVRITLPVVTDTARPEALNLWD